MHIVTVGGSVYDTYSLYIHNIGYPPALSLCVCVCVCVGGCVGVDSHIQLYLQRLSRLHIAIHNLFSKFSKGHFSCLMEAMCL